ncbi:defective proboscis extension response [Daphnia sinensis]|uniref:Defective proboscis extension response n=1 Tax=Daphnia sinensis TaxID=1820382 RepID=A0AAD5PYW5_9CRUS|nr:defective proboscis extension response [Daphnia sinensis]
MIEAHKGRHHNSKGSAATLLGHWDANSVADKSYGGNGSEAAAHQRAPLFDWESTTLAGWSPPLDALRVEHVEHGPQRIQEVTTTLGQTAFLHCRVRYLADRRVLWMRQRDLHILTSGLHTYTNDWRISAVHVTVRQPPHAGQAFPSNKDDVSSSYPPAANTPIRSPASRNASVSPDSSASSVWDDEEGVWSEWTLRIRSTEAKDAGLYECQVSTEPKISKIYRLHVVVSKASILGSAELFVKKGSDINLTCVTVTEEHQPPSQNAPMGVNKTPHYFTWHHNGQVLNYSARGGMSVTTDTIDGQSRLLLARAGPRDSGNYTCVPGPGAAPASVTVHVLNGEQPAAMQRDNAACLATPWWTSLPGIVTRTSAASCWTALLTLAVSSSWLTRSQLCDVT